MAYKDFRDYTTLEINVKDTLIETLNSRLEKAMSELKACKMAIKYPRLRDKLN